MRRIYVFLPHASMAINANQSPVVEERHIYHEGDRGGTSAAVMAVLLVVTVGIVAFLLFVMKTFPFNAVQENSTTEIDITLPTDAPDMAPRSNVAPDGVDY